jgi:UDP-N-acetylglucosamine acyltransferase
VVHDCIIGDQVIMANAASLGGHVVIEAWAILGGFTIVHQFCRIGAHSFSAMGSVVGKDVPPYVTIDGQPAVPRGINSEGLKRRKFSSEQISAIRRAYRLLYLSNLKLDEATLALATLAEAEPVVAAMTAFLSASARSIVR